MSGPYRDSGSSAPLCPACSVGLINDTIGKNRLLACVHCRGLWLDAAELHDLLMAPDRQEAVLLVGATLPRRDERGDRRCPRCATPMRPRRFGRTSAVTVDHCRHGVWFDAGELRDAVVHLVHEGERAAVRQERELERLARGAPAADAVDLARRRERDTFDARDRGRHEPGPLLDHSPAVAGLIDWIIRWLGV